MKELEELEIGEYRDFDRRPFRGAAASGQQTAHNRIGRFFTVERVNGKYRVTRIPIEMYWPYNRSPYKAKIAKRIRETPAGGHIEVRETELVPRACMRLMTSMHDREGIRTVTLRTPAGCRITRVE